MRHALLAVCVVTSLFFMASHATASPKLNLPIEATCNGAPVQVQGVFLCRQDRTWFADGKTWFRVKLPPVRGQLRVMDCNGDLTADGNPDDFNVATYKEGWWLWTRTVRRMDAPPAFTLPNRPYDNCAVSVSVAGEGTGVQTALLVYDSRQYVDTVSLSCAGKELKTKNGFAICKAFEGSTVTVTGLKKYQALGAIGTGCGVSRMQNAQEPEPISFKVTSGPCVVDFAGFVDATIVERSRVVIYGYDKNSQEIDNPVMIADGSKRRVFKPVRAKITGTEIYSKGQVLWRSGARDSDSYHLDPGEDNGPGLKEWPADAIACHTAYSEELQSMGGSCYELKSLKEVPYVFK